MPITITCPQCAQMCQVEDKHAGKKVRCPKCSNIIQVSAPEGTAVPVAAVPPSLPATPDTAVAPQGPAGPGFVDTLQQSATTFGLNPLELKLLYAGIGCLGAMVLFTFFPWVSIWVVAPGMGSFGGGSVLGISIWFGILNFLLSAAAMAFLIVALVVLKKKDAFDLSLYVAGGWSALAALWRLVDVARFSSVAGIGLFLALLASFGAAGTFGFILFQRFTKKKI